MERRHLHLDGSRASAKPSVPTCPKWKHASKRARAATARRKEAEFIASIYDGCDNVSIDYGIMEKADNVYHRGERIRLERPRHLG